MAKEVIQDWGTSGLDMRISAAQWRHPEYIWAYRGSEVHKEVASFSRFVRCSFRDADIKGFCDDYLELVDCVFTSPAIHAGDYFLQASPPGRGHPALSIYCARIRIST
jgi:hypothetical protein